MNLQADQIKKRYESLKSDRGNWDSLNQEIAEYLLPRKANFTRKWADGEERNSMLFDSTGMEALHLLASSLHGLMTNPSMQWARFADTSGDDLSQEEQEWMEDSIRKCLSVLNSDKSNFVPSVHEFYLDFSAFGVGCIYSEATEDEDDLFVKSYNISRVMFCENVRGVVDTVYRSQDMTVRQIAQAWGEEVLSYKMKGMLKESPDRVVEVIHAVMPREDAKRYKRDKTAKEKPFASFWIECETNSILSEGGYEEQPYQVSRWSKSPGELLGRGPGSMALPYLRGINAMALTGMMVAEKLADPPLMVPDDGFLGPVLSGPGGLTYYRAGIAGSSGDLVRPLPVSGDLNAIQGMIEWRSSQIQSIFLTPHLKTFENPNATATQVLAVQSEKMRVLGPVLGRLQTEFLSPFINRVFNILLRNGTISVPPESMQGKNIAVEYNNPISANQKQVEAQAFSNAMMYVAPVVQAKPEVMDNLDGDAAFRGSQKLFGYPADYLVPEDERDAMRQQRAQAMQAQQEAQLVQEAVGTAGEAKKAGLLDE